jgi:hypothetical protein
MKRVVASTVIEASPRRVWDLYADVAHSDEWIPFVEEVLSVSDPLGPGESYRERTRFMRVRDVSEWRIVEWDAPRRQVHRSRSKQIDMDLVIEIEAIGEGARVRQEAVLSSKMPGLLGKFHERALSFVARSGLEQAVAAAKRQLERTDA